MENVLGSIRSVWKVLEGFRVWKGCAQIFFAPKRCWGKHLCLFSSLVVFLFGHDNLGNRGLFLILPEKTLTPDASS